MMMISPDCADARFDLARAYALQGERQKAFSELTPLFAQEPNFARYHYETGLTLEAFGDKKMAAMHFQRAHRLNPKNGGRHGTNEEYGGRSRVAARTRP